MRTRQARYHESRTRIHNPVSTDPSPTTKRKLPPYHVYGALAGALCLGLLGASYGALLHFNPEWKEAIIRERLSAPHPDSRRYVASIQAIRYRGFVETVIRQAILPLVCGGMLGAGIGAVVGLVKYRRQPDAYEKEVPRPFSLIELLVVIAVVAVLVGYLMPATGAGLVYHQGKDQFYWLERVEHGPASEREEAIRALCTLLERKPFPCRATIIPAIAECGDEARIAMPILDKLSSDREESVRKAAIDALETLRSDARPQSSGVDQPGVRAE